MDDASFHIFERCLYIANILAAIIYGILLYTACSSVYLLATGHARTQKSRIFFIGYIIVMVICMTFVMASNALAGQMMWIEHRDTEGGPFAYYLATAANWTGVTGTTLNMFGNFMGDLLLLYRCYIIWNSSIAVIVLPSLIFLASTAMAIVSCVRSALPGSSFFASDTINFAIPWIALTCGLNAILTGLITARLLIARRRLKTVLGSNEYSTVYTSAISIIVESALPFGILGITFAILLGRGNTVYMIFNGILGTYTGLAPLLIIHRVALGRAWSKDTANQIMTASLNFAHHTSDATLHDLDLEKAHINTSSGSLA
ncbi:hypothetical protein Moror_15078 [Moniliophthora roreri MCA 2997]|uniref:Uncharacterized protein n=2 Tax=Moniliophthora roreri TaxID=221103 RepID=V2XV31_MONRO|nr:hypothetical protein Moror_15078 [Moniliophthora roreri MCA 2997]KAI3616797.1 hypothetical protein WG66_004297 [Moniliophthora roreri]